jgi:hypothetical protein
MANGQQQPTTITMAASGRNIPIAPHRRPSISRQHVGLIGDNPLNKRVWFLRGWEGLWPSKHSFIMGMMQCHNNPLQPPLNCMITHHINRGQCPEQVKMLFSRDEKVYGPQNAPSLWGWCIAITLKHFEGHKPSPTTPQKHIHLLRGLYTINLPCCPEMQVFLWGTRGPFLPAKAMVVLVFHWWACEIGAGESKPPNAILIPSYVWWSRLHDI